MKLVTHMHLVPKLRTHGALPPHHIRLPDAVLRHKESLPSFYIYVLINYSK